MIEFISFVLLFCIVILPFIIVGLILSGFGLLIVFVGSLWLIRPLLRYIQYYTDNRVYEEFMRYVEEITKT